jgi:hypothetical protein
MKTASLGTDEIYKGAGQRRADRKHRQRMSSTQRSDSVPPIIKTPPRLIWSVRGTFENYRFDFRTANCFIWQHEDLPAFNRVPTAMIDDCYSLGHVSAVQIFR